MKKSLLSEGTQPHRPHPGRAGGHRRECRRNGHGTDSFPPERHWATGVGPSDSQAYSPVRIHESGSTSGHEDTVTLERTWSVNVWEFGVLYRAVPV